MKDETKGKSNKILPLFLPYADSTKTALMIFYVIMFYRVPRYPVILIANFIYSANLQVKRSMRVHLLAILHPHRKELIVNA